VSASILDDNAPAAALVIDLEDSSVMSDMCRMAQEVTPKTPEKERSITATTPPDEGQIETQVIINNFTLN